MRIRNRIYFTARTTFASSAVALSIACSTSGSTTVEPSAAPVHKDSATTNVNVGRWVPLLATGFWHYRIHDSSTVSINSDTVTRALPLEAITSYSVSITNQGKSFLLSAHIDSLIVNGKLTTQSSVDTGINTRFQTGISARAQLEGSSRQASTVCSGAGISPAARIGEITTTLPPTSAKVGDKWTDTLSMTSCHGKIPLQQQAIRQFELLDTSSCEQHDAVKVRREVTNTFTGVSAESSTNHLSASGSGTASSILCLQRNTGILLESTGQSRLNLIITTSRGTFPFTQNTATHVELEKPE